MSHSCLVCGGTLKESLFHIPDLPLVDSFCNSVALAKSVPRYSIDLAECEACTTIQIASPPDTSEIYRNYIYESSSSPDLKNHFSDFAKFLNEHFTTDQKIVEIGANDGLLLKCLVDAGFQNLVGVDPSPQTALIDLPNTRIINDFFNEASVCSLIRGEIDAIVANNCFSHIPRLTEVMSLCERLLKKSGILFVEVQSTLELVEGVVFDYIYHEHYFYHTVSSMEKVAKLCGLELFNVQRVQTKGGSYRLQFGHTNIHPVSTSVAYWKYREELAGIHSPLTWFRLNEYLQSLKRSLTDLLGATDSTGLFGYGACATGTVLSKYIGFEEKLSAIVDDNLKRQGLFSPGTGTPVVSLSSVDPYQKCLVLAWRHSNLIAKKLQSKRIPYVIPLPYICING
jgi:hypothetical protein